MQVYGKSKILYEPNILGDYLKTHEYVNSRNYFKSTNDKSEYGIWWDGKDWILGSNLDKGQSIGYARLNKDSKNPDNQRGWELYYGEENGKPIWKKFGKDFGIKWKCNINLIIQRISIIT